MYLFWQDAVLMSFLSVKTVYLDSKECLEDKTTQPHGVEHEEGNFSSKDLKAKANNDKEIKQEDESYKPVTRSNDWRFPTKEKSKGKSMMISPVSANSSTLIAIGKGDGKTRKIESEMFMLKRSSSAPNCSYKRAKVTKQKFRLPCIPDLQALSINGEHPIKALFVEGKKLGSARRTGISPDAHDKNQELPKTHPKRIINNNIDNLARKPIPGIVIDGKKERHHGDWYEDALPAINKADLRVKSAYTNSSKVFNTYLQSRFGKSVYRGSFRKTGTSGDKTFQVYWAPVLIKKKVLNYRTTPSNCSQENGGEAIAVEEVSSKQRKILIEGSIYNPGGAMSLVQK